MGASISNAPIVGLPCCVNCDISKFENFQFCSPNNLIFFIEIGYNCPMKVSVNDFGEELVYLFSKLAFSSSCLYVFPWNITALDL